jgi:iron complex outermembrane receptor protein
VKTNTQFTRNRLRSGSALRALALVGAGLTLSAGLAAPAFAQDATDQDQSTQLPTDDQDAEGTSIVVTGTLFKTDTETPSPVTTLSAETLDQRGINTVAEAVQRLPSNGAGTITQGWNTGFNFATGANAVSLRGLTVQSTLTVFDGLRMAPYPLADDGHRNFVDLNTIPESIIDRIEVLRDGASSTYGADAVAGVVNVITKKEIQGIHLNGSAGISQRGDNGEQRLDGTFGYGDLDEQGFNVYVNGEYQHTSPLWARDRGYPFNTSDLSGVCDDAGHCMGNGITNGINPDGSFNGLGTTTTPVTRPYNTSPITFTDPAGRDVTFGPGELPLGPYTVLGGNCMGLPSVSLNGEQQGSVTPEFTPIVDDNGDPVLGDDGLPTYDFSGVGYTGSTYGATQCQLDITERYAELLPEQERLGFAGHVTANVGDNAQAYASVNYYQVRTETFASPLAFAGQTTPPGAVAYNPVFLPVYVCADGAFTGDNYVDNGCNATNGTLNPNNPYAADGQAARLITRYDRPRTYQSKSRALRGAIGISGSFGDNWNYTVDATASNVTLDITQKNFLIPSRLMDVIADGSYNFVNQSANSEEIRDYIAPTNRTRSESNLWQVQATLGKEVFQLPGGPLQAAVGVAYRHESINNPSANPADDAHPYDRYYSINAVGAVGSRNVKSAFFEINAPIVEQFVVNASGRYDDYSSGQTNFSPKIGAKFTPIPELALRGTFSKGFRIPSFNEAFGLPTTGYVTFQLDRSDPDQAAFIAAHGDDAYVNGGYSVGLTSTGNPGLDPEKSTSWTAGAIFQPISNVSFTVDYFHIKIKDLIGGIDYSGIPDLYYANNGVVDIPGVTVRPQLPDPQHPDELPLLGFIEYSFQNANSQTVSGIDFGANASFPIGGMQLTSNLQASYLLKFEKQFENGTVQRYDGTLSPCDVTSCSGSPKWRANWQNTLAFGDATVTATAYYTSGYDLASIDYGGVKGDCEASIGASVVTYFGTSIPVLCEADATWNVDMSASYKVDENFTFYVDVLNVLDIDPPFDPSAAYGLFQFNPAWAGPNILGRYFRVGAKVDF